MTTGTRISVSLRANSPLSLRPTPRPEAYWARAKRRSGPGELLNRRRPRSIGLLLGLGTPSMRLLASATLMSTLRSPTGGQRACRLRAGGRKGEGSAPPDLSAAGVGEA